VERMEEHKYAKENLEKKIAENEVLRKKKDLPKSEIEKLTKEAEQLQIAKSNLLKHESKIPLNVDTLSQPKFSKTVINKKEEVKNYDDMDDEEREQHMKKFVKENENIIKQYGMLRKFDDSKQFLMENNLLVHENTANYLVIWCINLEMEDKHDLMTHVAHQCICMQYMLELSRQLKCDPRSCIVPFFERIQVAGK
jgi:cell division cycle protein 37